MSHLFQINSSGQPSLGSGLDTNNHTITNSNTDGDINLLPNGAGKVNLDGDGSSGGVTISDGLIEVRTGTGSVADIRMYCEDSNAHYVSLNAPAHSSFSGNVNLTLPSSEGTNGQVLQTDGNGVTSWVDQSGGGGGGSLPTVTNPSGGTSGNDYTISSVSGLETTYLISYTTSPSATINVYLPYINSGSGVSSGYKINIKRVTSDPITINPSTSGSETIDGSSTLTLPYQYSSVTLQCDGSNWWVI